MPAVDSTRSEKLPFRSGTRQRFASVGSVAWTAGATLPSIILPRVGYLSRIVVQLRANLTFAGVGTFNAQAAIAGSPYLNRLRLNANIGSAALADISGNSLALWQRLVQGVGYSPDAIGVGGLGTQVDISAMPTAIGTANAVFTWILPVSANTGKQFDLGLIGLQSPETQVSLDLIAGTLADVYATNAPVVNSANIFVAYEYYEVPDPRVYNLPVLAICRLLEDSQPVTATGDNPYTMPRQGTLMQTLQRFIFNSTTSDALDRFAVRFNKTDTVYNWDRQFSVLNERVRYGVSHYVGAFFTDFWFCEGDVSQGDSRDMVDTEELSTLEMIPTITNGTTLGGVSQISTVRRIIQLLQAA